MNFLYINTSELQVVGFHIRYVVDGEGILSERYACMYIINLGLGICKNRPWHVFRSFQCLAGELNEII